MRVVTYGSFHPIAEYDEGFNFPFIVEMDEASITLESIKTKKKLVLTASDFSPKTKYLVMDSPMNGPTIVEHDLLFKAQEHWAFRKTVEVWGEVAVNIYFHTSWEDSVLFPNRGGYSDSIQDWTTVEGNRHTHDAIKELYPEGEYTVADNTNLRLEAFQRLSLIDSVVALEQQVDLLQSLVVSLLKGEKPPIWNTAFIQGTEGLSCTTLREPEELIEDVKTHKTTVRDAQRFYFDNRR